MTALLLDCDGVLADTERYGHLPAFNATFERYDLSVRWDEATYGEKLVIGGGKERMASLFAAPAFAAEAGVPDDDEGRRALLARWHATKTERFTAMVADGDVPARPGVRRLVTDALADGWTVAVCSTSAEASVRAVLRSAVGEVAQEIPVFAGDVVPAEKPDPAMYLLAVERLGLDPAGTVVVEDSRNGLLAATRAGLVCLVTVNGYTREQDFSEAALVVSELGDPGRPPVEVLRHPQRRPPGRPRHARRRAGLPGSRRMSSSAQERADLVVRTIATTAVDNEKHFGDLDRSDVGTFLKKAGMVITSRIGGTSGPIWGTAFLRAGAAAGDAQELSGEQVVAMLRAAIEGIKTRGGADVGDKTLLDVLVAMTDRIEAEVAVGAGAAEIVAAAAETAQQAAEATAPMVARHGRAAYTGERSISSVDAGGMAVAVIAEQIARAWQQRPDPTGGAS